jgi:hypothetical protein
MLGTGYDTDDTHTDSAHNNVKHSLKSMIINVKFILSEKY